MPLSALLLLVGLAAPQEEPDPSPAASNTALACDLYSRVAAREGNLFFSPYSISAALAMTLEGAAGETAAQMEELLHLSRNEAADAFQRLDRELTPPQVRDGDQEVDAYQLRIANALWAQEGLRYRERFAEVLRSSYRAGFADLDFRLGEQARATINGWVGEETEQKIQELIPRGYLTPDTLLVLTNAIYFQAPWQLDFPEGQTAPESFTTQDGRQIDVPMMRRIGTYRFAEVGDAQVLELPYRGGHLAMLVVLPAEERGLPALEERLDAELLATWTAALEPTGVELRLPRFRFSSSFDLTETLKAAGMTDAFDAGRADFSRLVEDGRLFVSAVLHEAHITVDESGTEAAAATAVTMKRGARPPEATVRFTADRPFLFLIRHRASGCVLFLGRVADPSRG